MTIAVTGGTGFIGKRLVAALLARGHTVHVLSRKPVPDKVAQGLRWIQGDLTEPRIPAGFLDGVDILFHCAGEISDPVRMHELHVTGTQRLVAAATGRIARWVQLSSTGAYGPRRTGSVWETSPLQPVGTYETTKVASDHLVTQAADSGAFLYSILRPSIVYGPGMPNQSLFAMMRIIEKGYFFFIGKPGASANYIHVDNVVDGLLACGFNSAASAQVFNLSDHCVMEEFVCLLASSLGAPMPSLRLPELPVRVLTRVLERLPGWPLTSSRVDAMTTSVSYPITKIEKLLQYQHRWQMAAGLADLVRYYRTCPR